MISRIIYIGLFLTLASCDQLPTELLLNGNFEFIDLAYPINNDTVVWPGVEKYRNTRQYAATDEHGDWHAVSEFCIGEHAGTHLDAPYHFHEKGMMVGDIPLEHLITSRIGSDVAEFIVRHYKNVVGVGLDTASVDPGSDLDYATHKSLAKNALYNIENANIPNGVPESGCVAVVMPMKLSYGTGAPLRLTAICPKEHQSESN